MAKRFVAGVVKRAAKAPAAAAPAKQSVLEEKLAANAEAGKAKTAERGGNKTAGHKIYPHLT